jgi:hypothetical protein
LHQGGDRGAAKYELEIYTPSRGSTVNTKEYAERADLVHDLSSCLPDGWNAEELVRKADEEGSSGIGDSAIELADDCASRLGWSKE